MEYLVVCTLYKIYNIQLLKIVRNYPSIKPSYKVQNDTAVLSKNRFSCIATIITLINIYEFHCIVIELLISINGQDLKYMLQNK